MTKETAYPGPVRHSLNQALAAFDELERIMGPDLARLCWTKIPKQSPRKRGPKGPRSAKEDSELLRIYDQLHVGSYFLIDNAENRVAELVVKSNEVSGPADLRFGASKAQSLEGFESSSSRDARKISMYLLANSLLHCERKALRSNRARIIARKKFSP
jgi:hypothetical protein